LIAYDQDGGFENLELTLGQGYFLAVTADLENMESLTLNGDVVTSDDYSRATLAVDGGWTLLSNPLVSSVNKSMLTVTTNDETYSWDDAVAFGFVSPTVYGWDNGYASNQNLVRFQGNWLHTSRSLDVNVRPHTAGALSRMDEVDGWKLSLRASDKNGLASSELVTVGITENANNDFTYGEDEFDLPDPMVDSYVDLFINNMNWIGEEDINGNIVETPYFAADIRSIPEINDAQVWNVSGIAHNMVGDVELTWNMEEIDNSYLIQLQVNSKTYDLRDETSITVSQNELSNMNLLIGSGSMGSLCVGDVLEMFWGCFRDVLGMISG
jgi:hypothetical protein